MAREAGAKSIIFASASPPVRHSHIYGIDLANSDELIAYSKTSTEVATAIGADTVIYQTLPDLVAACVELSPPGRDCHFESGVFSGCYVTGVPDGYFEHLALVRGETNRSKTSKSQVIGRVDLQTTHHTLVTPNGQDINLHNLNH